MQYVVNALAQYVEPTNVLQGISRRLGLYGGQ